jgi:hypothetical protein
MKRTSHLRLLALAITTVMVMGACADDTFSDVGDRTTGWIGDVAASSTTVATTALVEDDVRVAALALSSAAGLTWFNDGLDFAPSGSDALTVARQVWDRSDRAEEFVQAHRADVASALPGVKFPGAIPASVEYVTSQLVFVPITGSLDDEVSAAFGLWSAEPYTQSRAAGQEAVLLVGLAVGDQTLPPCERVLDIDAVACRDVAVDGRDAAELEVESGIRLVWWENEYRYELFYRAADEPEVGMLMAESMVELAHVEEDAFSAYRDVASRTLPLDGAAPTR